MTGVRGKPHHRRYYRRVKATVHNGLATPAAQEGSPIEAKDIQKALEEAASRSGVKLSVENGLATPAQVEVVAEMNDIRHASEGVASNTELKAVIHNGLATPAHVESPIDAKDIHRALENIVSPIDAKDIRRALENIVSSLGLSTFVPNGLATPAQADTPYDAKDIRQALENAASSLGALAQSISSSPPESPMAKVEVAIIDEADNKPVEPAKVEIITESDNRPAESAKVEIIVTESDNKPAEPAKVEIIVTESENKPAEPTKVKVTPAEAKQPQVPARVEIIFTESDNKPAGPANAEVKDDYDGGKVQGADIIPSAALAQAPSTVEAKQQVLDGLSPLDQFFRKTAPDFKYSSKTSSFRQFHRLLQTSNWDQDEKKERKWEFCEAVAHEFELGTAARVGLFGFKTDDDALAYLWVICKELGWDGQKELDNIRDCRRFLQKKHVCIFDYVDARRRNAAPKIRTSIIQFGAYIHNRKKKIPRDIGKSTSACKALLKRI